jgi:hypothetical protein
MTPLEEADANIASILEELRCVQQKLSDACTRRNALMPACKLHPELLTLIFELLKDPATNECRAEDEQAHFWLPRAPVATLDWTSVTAVCRHFRDVGLSEPRLWAALNLDWHPAIIQKHMERNGERALDLILYTATPENGVGALAFLQQYAHRVRYLDIDPHLAEWDLGISYPRLSQLRIVQNRGDINMFYTHRLCHTLRWLVQASSLTSLEIHGLKIDTLEVVYSFPDLPSLLHLLLRGLDGPQAASFLFEFLDYTPALEVLYFEASNAEVPQPSHLPALPHLREIEIHVPKLCAAALIQSLPEPASGISVELYGHSEDTFTPPQFAAMEAIFTRLTAFWRRKTGHAHLPSGQIWSYRSSYAEATLRFDASELTPSGDVRVWVESRLSWKQPYPFLQSRIQSLHLDGVSSSWILCDSVPIMACLGSLRSIAIQIHDDAVVIRQNSNFVITYVGPESRGVQAWIVKHGNSIEQIDFKNCSEEWRTMGTNLQGMMPAVRLSWTNEAEDDAI